MDSRWRITTTDNSLVLSPQLTLKLKMTKDLNNGGMKPIYFECKSFRIIGLTSCSQGRDLRDPIAQYFLSTKSRKPSCSCGWETTGHVGSVHARCYMGQTGKCIQANVFSSCIIYNEVTSLHDSPPKPSKFIPRI